MEEKHYVTEEGLAKLKEELEELVHVIMPQLQEELGAAKAQGDLSENADYDVAKDKISKYSYRITELQQQIDNAEIITKSKSTKYVRLGSTVEVEELDTNDKFTYMIVGSVESDPLNGKLSYITPLAEAILDQKVGSVVTVKAEYPYDVKILKVS